MPQHARYVEGLRNNRVSIKFERSDLLLSKKLLRNPYDGKSYDLPVYDRNEGKSHSFYFGPNILDSIERVFVKRNSSEAKRYGLAKSTAPTTAIWRFRDPQQFFRKPKKKRNKKSSTVKKPKRKDYYPFKSEFATGGRLLSHAGDFAIVTKISSVSISSQLFLLIIGMCNGSTSEASSQIAKEASEAWQREIFRAEQLYSALKVSDGFLLDSELPSELKADAAVSQEVEQILFQRVINWMGIPNIPFSRKRGRPKSRPDIIKGKYIEIKIALDRVSITGRTIAVVAGYSANTDLASLTLLELVSILAELQELEEAEDEDLLLAFLDALDPDWQTNVFEEEENYQSLEDPYTVLNISQDANTDEIKKAYRNLARQVHPDTSGLPDWIFKQINRAYESLEHEAKDE